VHRVEESGQQQFLAVTWRSLSFMHPSVSNLPLAETIPSPNPPQIMGKGWARGRPSLWREQGATAWACESP